MALQTHEEVAATKPGAFQIALERQRLVVGGKGLAIAPLRAQDVAAAEPGFGELGLER
jgi:hypothetical protein